MKRASNWFAAELLSKLYEGTMNYESTVRHESQIIPGVSFTIARMSFSRRIELTRRIRELSNKVEFLEAGADAREKIEASLLAQEVQRLYLEWGLQQISGLQIDGREVDTQLLISDGPEDLSNEIVAAIRAECGLNPEERKN